MPSDQLGAVAALKHMANATVTPVETLRVRTVQDPHSFRQVRLRRSDRDMEMVSEQAVALADPAVSRNDLADLRDEPDEIPIIQAHSLLRVAPRRNVVERTGEFDPLVSAHRSSVGFATVEPRLSRDFGASWLPNWRISTGSRDMAPDPVLGPVPGPGPAGLNASTGRSRSSARR